MATDEPGAGPLVHRTVREAGVVWILAAVQFVVAMIVTQLGWSAAHPYSLKNNYISDLGNTACGYFPSGSTTYVCSPWHNVFNGSVTFLGLLVIFGALLVPTAFVARRIRTAGLALVLLAGVGAAGVGVFPENVNGTVHGLTSALAFVAGGLALLVLGVAMIGDRRWDGGYRPFSLVLGVVTLGAPALFLTGVDLGLGVGGMERLIVAPLLLWLVVASLHLLRLRAFAPRTVPGASGS
jgi:hypothetical membrane protein